MIPEAWDFALTSWLRHALRNQAQGNDAEPGSVRDYQANVPRQSQQLPSERHPLHTSGFRRTCQRVGGTPSDMNLELAQRISSSLDRDSSRAILRETLLLHQKQMIGGWRGTTPTPTTTGQSHGLTQS